MRNALAVVLVATMAGCVSTNAIQLGVDMARPPVPSKDVAIYRTPEQVPGEYDEVAILHSSGDTAQTSEADMFRSMRAKAGKLGANAIILGGLDEPSAGSKVAHAVFFGFLSGPSRKGRAIAIFVHPPKAETDPNPHFVH